RAEDPHQSLGVRIRQSAKQERIEHAEHRGVRPDAEREREHGHGGETRVLQQLTEGASEIVHSRIYDLRFTRWRIQNPKRQAPEKSQAPNPKCRIDTAELELEIWT